MVLLTLLSACSQASGKSLPLEDYRDPQDRYSFAIPEGWSASVEEQVLTIVPSNYGGDEEEIVIRVYTSPTNTIDTATHIDLD